MILFLQWNRTLSQLQKMPTLIHYEWIHFRKKSALQKSSLYTNKSILEFLIIKSILYLDFEKLLIFIPFGQKHMHYMEKQNSYTWT